MAHNNFIVFQQENLRYQQKWKRVKKLLKNLVFENAALCDQVAQIQENILCIKEERRFLLKRLLEHNAELITEARLNTSLLRDSNGTAGQTSMPKQRTNKKRTHSEATASGKGKNATKSTKSKKHAVQTIAVDAFGRAIFPIQIGYLTIHDLGEICFDRSGYHTDNWIYPIGFVSTRVYGHIKDPEQKCTYTCKISDGGDVPRFDIIPDFDSEYIISGLSPDLCHAALLQAINANADVRHIDVNPHGEWFFGLGQPTVMTLIQNAPNARKCTNFKSYQNDIFTADKENDPTVNFDALQKSISISVYHTVPEIKEEPPDELLEQSDGGTLTSFNLT